MRPEILLIGKPNSGKSLLFNRLTGLEQKVSNFPGVTVEIKRGYLDGYDLIDHPGIYSFNAVTKDEQVAVERFQNAISRESVKAVLCILDVTRLERSLALGLQAQNLANNEGKPVVFALNMMDVCISSRVEIDLKGLEKELGSKVIPISARTQFGLSDLRSFLHDMAEGKAFFDSTKIKPVSDIASRARELQKKYLPNAAVFLKNHNRLDRFFLSSILGGPVFLILMILLFQSIFTWSTPLMDAVEGSIAWIGHLVASTLPDGVFQDFVRDALFGGVGSFLVFVPQIFVLTFIIGILEDSGYLARAALIVHKPLSLFGLTGRSFVPFLSGHACAIPAIMAARIIDSPKRRLLTILTIPLMACSARLPVYALLITTLIPPIFIVQGLIGLRGLVFFSLYAFGILVALIVSALLSKSILRNESDSPFILELPPYRLPHWHPLFLRSMQASKAFVVKAGWVIFSVTVVVWILGYFPGGTGQLQSSWLAILGHWIEPVFQPLGLDWKFGVAILTSFVAREVFVGTLGTLFGIESAEENIIGLADSLQSYGLSLASGLSLLVFYAVALQCASTLAVIKKETGNGRLALASFFGYGSLAYILAYLVYTFVKATG